MCSRFALAASPREVALAFDLRDPPAVPNAPEIRPSDQILVIDEPGRSGLRQWGIPAPWDGSLIFNARSESVTAKPTFRDYLDGRCLIPASAWFEWRKDGKTKHKTRIAPSHGGAVPFAFAGLCNAQFATILTTAAIATLEAIHSRMPVVLSSGEAVAWLDPSRSLDDLKGMLEPHDVAGLEGTPMPTEKTRRDSAQGELFS